MTDAVTKLGVRPVYPPTESMRLGTVLLADGALNTQGNPALPHQETALRITGDLERRFEEARRRQFSAQEANRFFPSSSDLADSLRPTNNGHAFFRQTSKLGDQEGRPTSSLPLAALPGYTLASVDQASFAAFLPGLLASFFASIGFQHTSYLRIEAEGIEVAELPLAEVVATLDAACRERSTPAREKAYGHAVSMAYDIFEAQRRNRERNRMPTKAVLPRLHLVRKVFYMRGIRFVTEDSRVTAAMLDAAIKKPVPDGASTVAPATITINNAQGGEGAGAGVAPPPGSPRATEAANAATIAALQKQLADLRKSLATGSNTQIAASFARAATVGVELVQLFDRPLAFGYQSMAVPSKVVPGKFDDDGNTLVPTVSFGWRPLCDEIQSAQ